MDNATLSHNLRRLRDEKNLTQAQVAERTGISPTASPQVTPQVVARQKSESMARPVSAGLFVLV